MALASRRSSRSARSQSSSAEPLLPPRVSQYEYARRAIWSNDGTTFGSESPRMMAGWSFFVCFRVSRDDVRFVICRYQGDQASRPVRYDCPDGRYAKSICLFATSWPLAALR